MKVTLEDIAAAMSEYASTDFNTKIEISAEKICKIPAWEGSEETEVYIALYQYFLVEVNVENGEIVGIQIISA